MAYTCELSPGQHIYLDNRGDQTSITIATSSAGQQQQAGSQFTTGAWTSPPELFRTEGGVVIKLTTPQGVHHLHWQGSQLGRLSAAPQLGSAQQLQVSGGATMPTPPMQPMQPMQPMKMGDMEMNPHPMQMRMGNMEMRMGEDRAAASSGAAARPKFCSQCGTPVQPSDRFCANCGHQLGT